VSLCRSFAVPTATSRATAPRLSPNT
jgi:hypothetical protein